MIYQEINVYEFRDAFIRAGRNYFSYEGYQALYDWLDDMGENYELDVIALSGEFVEETFDEIATKYSIELEEVLNYLSDNTCIIYQTEESVLYADF